MTNNNKKPAAGSFAKLMAQPASPPDTGAATKKESKKISKQENNIASNITLLQFFNEKDIEDLREPAYMAQTYRLRERDIEWIKDTAHGLSKEFKRRKISQTDILRIAFKLFEKALATNKEELKTLLDKIK